MNTERQKQFVSCEVSRKLKEKFFNEPTMAFYDENGDFKFVPYNESDINLPNSVTKTENENKYSSAPLWQECIDFLRKKGIHIYINPFNEVLSPTKAVLFKWAILNHSVAKEFSTFEVAREQVILKALELIKIN